jgi:hypothetical protein
LAENNVMDYSLLVGIYYECPERKAEVEAAMAEFRSLNGDSQT